MEFPLGGFFLIRETDAFTFIKCGSYKDRPSHADNLHIDIWYKGENLLFDGGSYLYNTDEKTVKYFAGTESHNTVMLDEHDQMLKGPRFIWLNWSRAKDISISETETEFVFNGSVGCFTYLGKDIVHRRKIIKTKGAPMWMIADEITGKPDEMITRQLWHSSENEKPKHNLQFSSSSTGTEIKDGWRSLYYGVKEKTVQTEFRTKDNKIETTIRVSI